jgi:peptidoglycan/xylan/chitin deacetylase (PgdA/CDA1 family)
MPNRICFASVDVERTVENLDKILSIFEKNAVPATLFVTGEILESNQNLFAELQKKYEIACHSFTHRFWNTLNKEEREKELDDFVNLYQKIFNKKPLGFRAPSHVIDAGG